MLTYISNTAHYLEVLSLVPKVKHNLWIGTADIKDLYVEDGKQKNVSIKRGQKELILSAEREKSRGNLKPFLAVLAGLIQCGVEVRLIHAKEPGSNFREDFDKYPVLYDRLERVLCPRVHFKMIVFDCKETYLGSANLTGAGIGMKTDNKRNFEAGILTNPYNGITEDVASRQSSCHQLRRIQFFAYAQQHVPEPISKLVTI